MIASTGRTATSFVAECLNHIPHVIALHEGHLGNDQGVDVLPLVNLDNFHAYKSADKASEIVAKKRNSQLAQSVLAQHGKEILIDAAYYNAVLMGQVLLEHEDGVGVSIIRDCESFVRSATWIHGEDPMPVGWPEPQKTLSPRERFVSMGRLRPVSGDAMEEWPRWGAIERNIWLWRETNSIMLNVKETWPKRVALVNFSDLVQQPVQTLTMILEACSDTLRSNSSAILNNAVQHSANRKNSRVGGYHIGECSTWTKRQQELLMRAEDDIFSRVNKCS